MLAHKAEHDGVACVEAIAGKTRHGAQPIPSCVYANPQIASVGVTEAAATERGQTVRVGRFSLRGNGKALVMGEPDGLVKCVFDVKCPPNERVRKARGCGSQSTADLSRGDGADDDSPGGNFESGGRESEVDGRGKDYGVTDRTMRRWRERLQTI